MAYIAYLLAIIIVVYVVIPAGIKRIMRGCFLASIAKSGCVCITFDDGPDPRSTLRILDILKEFKVSATFFVSGRNAKYHPGLISRIIAEGHEIGEHSFYHTSALTTGPLATWIDLTLGRDAIAAQIAKPIKLFRPPYGKLNLMSLLYLVRNRRISAFWNLDPQDFACDNARQIAGRVFDKLKPGSIVLLHDGRQDASASPEPTIAALPIILQACRDKHLPLATISQALAIQNPIP